MSSGLITVKDRLISCSAVPSISLLSRGKDLIVDSSSLVLADVDYRDLTVADALYYYVVSEFVDIGIGGHFVA